MYSHHRINCSWIQLICSSLTNSFKSVLCSALHTHESTHLAGGVGAIGPAQPVACHYRDFFSDTSNDPFSGNYTQVLHPYGVPLANQNVLSPAEVQQLALSGQTQRVPSFFNFPTVNCTFSCNLQDLMPEWDCLLRPGTIVCMCKRGNFSTTRPSWLPGNPPISTKPMLPYVSKPPLPSILL